MGVRMEDRKSVVFKSTFAIRRWEDIRTLVLTRLTACTTFFCAPSSSQHLTLCIPLLSLFLSRSTAFLAFFYSHLTLLLSRLACFLDLAILTRETFSPGDLRLTCLFRFPSSNCSPPLTCSSPFIILLHSVTNRSAGLFRLRGTHQKSTRTTLSFKDSTFLSIAR
jgi:hypothetical protein